MILKSFPKSTIWCSGACSVDILFQKFSLFRKFWPLWNKKIGVWNSEARINRLCSKINFILFCASAVILSWFRSLSVESWQLMILRRNCSFFFLVNISFFLVRNVLFLRKLDSSAFHIFTLEKRQKNERLRSAFWAHTISLAPLAFRGVT